MAHLEVAMGSMVADMTPLIRGLDNVSIVGGIIISLRSAGRNLVAWNEHN